MTTLISTNKLCLNCNQLIDKQGTYLVFTKFCSDKCQRDFHTKQMPKIIKEKLVNKNEVYTAWVCSCEEGWIIPCEYTHCGKCGASDHFNASTKERNIIMPPWYIEAQ